VNYIPSSNSTTGADIGDDISLTNLKHKSSINDICNLIELAILLRN
jgi:hypothetical protein